MENDPTKEPENAFPCLVQNTLLADLLGQPHCTSILNLQHPQNLWERCMCLRQESRSSLGIRVKQYQIF